MFYRNLLIIELHNFFFFNIWHLHLEISVNLENTCFFLVEVLKMASALYRYQYSVDIYWNHFRQNVKNIIFLKFSSWNFFPSTFEYSRVLLQIWMQHTIMAKQNGYSLSILKCLSAQLLALHTQVCYITSTAVFSLPKDSAHLFQCPKIPIPLCQPSSCNFILAFSVPGHLSCAVVHLSYPIIKKV